MWTDRARRTPRPATLVALAVAATALGGCAGPPREPAPRTVALFDGTTLAGWSRHGGEATFTVEDGCIVGRPSPRQRNAFLCTTADYADFALSLEFRIDPGFNSGVQFRSRLSDAGDPAKERVVGYQCEIDPSSRAWTAGIYEEGLRGWLAPLAERPEARAAFRPHDWNRLRIEAVGPRLRTWLNGVPAADLTDQAAQAGFIALQVHSIGERDDAPTVRFRRIELELPDAVAQGAATQRPDR